MQSVRRHMSSMGSGPAPQTSSAPGAVMPLSRPTLTSNTAASGLSFQTGACERPRRTGAPDAWSKPDLLSCPRSTDAVDAWSKQDLARPTPKCMLG